MKSKSSKEYSNVFLVEGVKFKLRNLPLRTSSLLCPAAKQKNFVTKKKKNETNQ